MEPKLQVKDAAFNYGKRTIFSGLNLDVLSGEVVCILGPNGCGKTTLMRCMNGLLNLNKGHILLDGQKLDSMPPDKVAKTIGFVFQDHNLTFPFSVLEVVRMGRAPHLSFFASPSQVDTEIAIEALTTVGLLHLKDKPYTQISGGERQLVFIARVLAQKPQVVLMDEPTSHLDFKNQVLVLRMIDKLAAQGLTVVMTTHLPDQAILYSSKVALMNSGRFIATGAPSEVMTEQNIGEVYGMKVRILQAKDPASGEVLKFVVPAQERFSLSD